MSDYTISSWYGMVPEPPTYYVRKLKVKDPAGADPTLLLGVEFEIENTEGIDGDPESHVVPGMIWKEDGSLRNRGLEFITKPMTYDHLEHTTREFFDKNNWNEENYSERCSIHVHANCRDLTFRQVGSILLLYQAFERLLYAFVGADRDKNIFCVPWSESMMTYNIVSKLQTEPNNVIRGWQKYLGLNLFRLQDLGTLEFRHMPGIYDVSKILSWYQIIGCLFANARNQPLEYWEEELSSINTTSAYGQLLERVFGQWAPHLRVPGYEQLLEEGILNIKFMLIGAKSKAATLANPFDDFLQPTIRPPGRPLRNAAADVVRDADWARNFIAEQTALAEGGAVLERTLNRDTFDWSAGTRTALTDVQLGDILVTDPSREEWPTQE